MNKVLHVPKSLPANRSTRPEIYIFTNPEANGEQRAELSVPDMIFKRQERLEELKIEFSFVPEQKRITVRLRRIFATTLTRRPVTTFFSTRPKEDTSETSWALSIATSVSEKNEKWTSKKTFSALRAFHKT